MANTSSRTLRLLSLLQSHRFWAGDELAGRLGVSIRTLRRDVDRLRELGYPVDARRGVDGGYQLAPGAVLPPLVVDDEEAVALGLGLLAVAQGPVAGMAEASVRALSKVIQVMPRVLRRRLEAVRGATEQLPLESAGTPVDPGVLTTLAQACRDAERVEFGYESGEGVAGDRSVEPLRLVPVGQRWYLVAYDLDRGDWRTFRLDRLTTPRTTVTKFAPRRLPAGDAATFVRAGLARTRATEHVLAIVVAPADRVRDRIGRWADVTPGDSPDRCRVRINAESLDWAAMALGVLPYEFTVISPPEAVAHLAAWAQRFTRATTGQAAGVGLGPEG